MHSNTNIVNERVSYLSTINDYCIENNRMVDDLQRKKET